MKKVLVVGALLTMVGCGYISRENEMIGQVKNVVHSTPLICSDYSQVDISLGILRDGVGSVSSEDVWLYYNDKEQDKILKMANETGKLVKIKYDTKRVTWCVPNRIIISIEIID